ncbi:hypothetical protein PRUB_a2302 [Pseudoalteromonas rubra]|uniref:Uncharacterized protein n=1 Tax=Pseudoalteromonas rubra TaxID=43658 RepID=A0A8T0CAU0_9GAMM|nr:hypothetical protein PRUB_a2302 [Pseudoalteromonas rubra]
MCAIIHCDQAFFATPNHGEPAKNGSTSRACLSGHNQSFLVFAATVAC